MNNKLIIEHMDIILLTDGDNDDDFDSSSPHLWDQKRKSYENKQKSKKDCTPSWRARKGDGRPSTSVMM